MQIKVITEEHHDFEDILNTYLEKGWEEQADTYRLIDCAGKLIHSIIITK